LKTTYFDVNGERTSEEKSTYDAQGHCISIILQDMDPENESVENHLKYNAQGKVAQVVELLYGGKFDTMMVSSYTYQDTLLVERIDHLDGLYGKNWTKTTLSYDKQQRLIRDEITDSEIAGAVSYKTFGYDSQGRIAKEEWFRRGKKALQKIRSVTWAYE
jgi:hypothetical protein